MKRLLSATAIAATALIALTACGSTQSASDASSSGSKITITDATGTKVTLDGPAEKVVGTEWNVVEDLETLGVAPVGVADVKGYGNYDSAVPLTGDPKDIGTRGEPSTDTIAALAPDLIVATNDLKVSVVKQLRKIAPTIVVASADGKDQLGTMQDTLDMIAKATGTAAEAKTVWSGFEDKLAAGKKELADAGKAGTSVAMADGYELSNQVTIRPYTSTSALGTVNERLGLENAWDVDGDAAYGLGSTDVEGLTKLGADTQFLYIANKADGNDVFADSLASNDVWKSLPFVEAGNVHRLTDGIWMFGGPGSMEAYIDATVAAITK
ncbi:iron complex transport system substrate-binding protein [Curtobacterium sp. PhB130]|uniref:iron-siderophore ABC transporter substrate-binding protein n=1 Tax=Curtobacterium sp. PhB130 TaxID=2485178 RepID=UPI000F4D26B6|nr:iron-siderophore ABC transporter substrate-binding protein [Curtobacterium sp. PhB130]ROS78077.1 iron complex transport system substrate-binding protein [Curtobacterium sp. PhB130]